MAGILTKVLVLSIIISNINVYNFLTTYLRYLGSTEQHRSAQILAKHAFIDYFMKMTMNETNLILVAYILSIIYKNVSLL